MEEKRLTRDEQKGRRSLEKAFQSGLRQQAKSSGWGYVNPTSFNHIGDWFVSVDPMIWTEVKRAQLHATAKPFAIDDLMSRILGFEGLDERPLSLRARGPHCLVCPMFVKDVECDGDLEGMLSMSAEFLNEVACKVQSLSLDEFITFTSGNDPSGDVSYNHVAALILAQRSEDALTLCDQAIAVKQWGGPARMTEDGRIIGFFELAAAWLRRKTP